jgi:hypothetical protein
MMHPLVIADSFASEPVLDDADLADDLHVEAGLLRDLAEGGLLQGLAFVRSALGQAPDTVRGAPADHDIDAVVAAKDDAPGRDGALDP